MSRGEGRAGVAHQRRLKSSEPKGPWEPLWCLPRGVWEEERSAVKRLGGLVVLDETGRAGGEKLRSEWKHHSEPCSGDGRGQRLRMRTEEEIWFCF